VYDKVFVVNFNKHATTAIHHMFGVNGLKCYHGVHWWRQRGKHVAERIVDSHDVLSDGSPQMVKGELQWLVDMYPQSRFILPVRSLCRWVISRFLHGDRMRKMWPDKIDSWMWAYPPSLDRVNKWSDQLYRHVTNVFHMMQKHADRLWVVDIENPDWEQYVREQFDLQVKDQQHRNITADNEQFMRQIHEILYHEDSPMVSAGEQYDKMLREMCKQHGYNTNLL